MRKTERVSTGCRVRWDSNRWRQVTRDQLHLLTQQLTEMEEAPAIQLMPLGQVLLWIDYNTRQVQVLEEELGDLPTLGMALRTEIADVLKTYAQRTVGAGRIVLGLVKTKQTQGLAHWVRYF